MRFFNNKKSEAEDSSNISTDELLDILFGKKPENTNKENITCPIAPSTT